MPSQRNLETILKRKRNKPKAYRALKRKDYKALFECYCPRMVRYTPSKEIARAVVKHVTKGLPRLKAKTLAWTIASRMHKLPLRIGVERPSKCHLKNPKISWYEMGIRDRHIRDELSRYFKRKSYTHRKGTINVRSRKYKFGTIFIHTK